MARRTQRLDEVRRLAAWGNRVKTDEEFSHGHEYGIYSGVAFYGPPTDDFRLDRLLFSDCYVGPLFHGILDRALRVSGGEQVPSLVSEWNRQEGWSADDGPAPVAPAEAGQLAAAIAQLSVADVSQYCFGCTADECIRCADAVREFIRSRLDCDADLFIEQY